MKKRIGIIASSLQSRYPRGIHRVARNIAELIVLSDEFDFVCLTSRRINQPEITYNCVNLAQWLQNHPLQIDVFQRRSIKKLIKIGTNRIATLLLPPLLLAFIYIPIKSLVKSINAFFKAFSIFPRYRKDLKRDKNTFGLPFISVFLKSLKRYGKLLIELLCPPLFLPLFDWFSLKEDILILIEEGESELNLESSIVTVNDLDLIISFEVFEEIWNLPIETYSTKFICWVYDTIPLRINEGKHWQPDMFASCLGKALLKSDRVLCISASTERDVIAFSNDYLNCQTDVVYLGHDTERFGKQYNVEEIHKTLIKFGIDVNTPYLICLGAIEPRKNIVNILRACILLCRTAPELKFQLVMVGQEAGQTGFYQLVEQVKKYMPVIYTGYANDTDAAVLLKGAKVFLYPSLWEGFGIPPLEAMTSETIVITSDVSSLPEVCEEYPIYCDPYNPQDIADSIHLGLEMPVGEREKRVQAAKIHAAKFTWDKACEQVLSILREELLEPKKNSCQHMNSELNLSSYKVNV